MASGKIESTCKVFSGYHNNNVAISIPVPAGSMIMLRGDGNNYTYWGFTTNPKEYRGDTVSTISNQGFAAPTISGGVLTLPTSGWYTYCVVAQ